jgi:serine phosphatase RsbU (regulator of sigma subunit)
VFCPNTAALLDRYPNLRSMMEGAPESAYVAVPLRSVDAIVGAIGFVYRGARTFGPGDRALVAALADHVALAMERSMLFESNRSVAEALSTALAPPPVIGDGEIPVAARYRAAGVGDIGGAWYDVLTSPRGSQIYVVGDVVGRGLPAVATMAQLRQSLRMLLLEGHDPADALGTLSAEASVETMALCSTVCCAEVETGSQTVHLTSAGHLPPVVVGPERAQLVDLPVGPPLGVGAGPPTRTIRLASDECLVMFTDGVIERRDHHIDESLRRVCAILAATPATVEAIADTLLDHAQPADDDATILVVGGSRNCSAR